MHVGASQQVGDDCHSLFTAEVWDDGRQNQRPPSITTPDGVLASLGSWALDRPADPKTNRPAMWQGHVEVVWERLNQLPADAALTISLDRGGVASVPILTP